MTEQDGHSAASAPSSPPAEPEHANALAEAAAALGFGGDGSRDAAESDSADQPTVAVPTRQPTQVPPRATSPHQSVPSGVPPRPQPLPPPRPVRPPAGAAGAPRPAPSRPASSTVRPVARTRKARLVLKRIDPWSVFLYSVVASIFIGVATLVAVGLLYAVLSKLGVLSSLNTFIGDVTADSGANAQPAHVFSAGKVMTFATLIAALDVVLITALSTLAAFLYNVCASLTGGIEVTLTDQG